MINFYIMQIICTHFAGPGFCRYYGGMTRNISNKEE